MKATAKQKQLIAINCPDRDLRAILVQEVTGDYNKTSTNDLSFDEANEILAHFNVRPVKAQPTKPAFDKNNTQHRRILSTLIQLGWSKPHDKYGEVADLDHFNNWLKSDKSPVKMNGRSSLTQLTKDECTKIIGALDKITSKKYAKAQ